MIAGPLHKDGVSRVDGGAVVKADMGGQFLEPVADGDGAGRRFSFALNQQVPCWVPFPMLLGAGGWLARRRIESVNGNVSVGGAGRQLPGTMAAKAATLSAP
jgi:hypothetical protein